MPARSPRTCRAQLPRRNDLRVHATTVQRPVEPSVLHLEGGGPLGREKGVATPVQEEGEADALARGTPPVPAVKPCVSAALAAAAIDQREQIPLQLEPQLRFDVLGWHRAETERGSTHVGISKRTCRAWRLGPNPAAGRPTSWARDVAPRLLDIMHATKIPGSRSWPRRRPAVTLLATLPSSLRFLPA